MSRRRVDDDDRQVLFEGKQAARELAAKVTAEKLEEIRDRAVRRFFGEAGVPPHLAAGWAQLDEDRRLREEIGAPLPPGGVLLLGRESVIAGCMAELHGGLAAMLSISVDRIRLKLDRTPHGRLSPIADIDLPSDWLLPVATSGDDPDAATERYLAQCVEMANAHFRRSVSARLGSCDTHRPDVAQPISHVEAN
jgi:hypothetical protein